MCTSSQLHSCFVLYLVISVQSANAQSINYALFELRSLNAQVQSDAVGDISAEGDVAGGGYNGENFSRALVWSGAGEVIDLGTLGGDTAGASGMSDVGTVCGRASLFPGQSTGHACLWHQSGIVDLGTLGGRNSVARAVNDFRQVVGQSEYEWSSYAMKAFLWENGRMTVLRAPNPERDAGAAWDINNRGEIVGEGLNENWEAVALLWRDGEVIDLGSLDGHGSGAEAINEFGVIAGRSETVDSRHAVIWVDGQIIDIHSLGPDWWSHGRAINNAGTVVGFAVGPPGFVAFVREPGQPMQILNELVPPQLRLPWRIADARAINDAGQIAANGELDSRPANLWAFLLSPVYPTMTLQGPQPGQAGAMNGMRVTGAMPGVRVYFLYSRTGGGTRIPGCDLQQNALQLANPTIIGSAIADANGVATINRNVPLIARGQTILFQAVVQNECAISQLVGHEFQ